MMLGDHRLTIELGSDVGDFLRGVAEEELRETQDNVAKGLNKMKVFIRGNMTIWLYIRVY